MHRLRIEAPVDTRYLWGRCRGRAGRVWRKVAADGPGQEQKTTEKAASRTPAELKRREGPPTQRVAGQSGDLTTEQTTRKSPVLVQSAGSPATGMFPLAFPPPPSPRDSVFHRERREQN